jgi:hypothetical protein
MFCLGLVGWAFNAAFYLSPLGLLPLSLGYSYYLLLRASMSYVLFHVLVVGLKKFVPTLFLNLVRLSTPSPPPPHISSIPSFFLYYKNSSLR